MNNTRSTKRNNLIVGGLIATILVLGITSGIGAYFATRSDKMKPISTFIKPEPLPKYFAIDVDGTFYTKDAAVFKKNVEAFKLLKKKGITPFFCTGRSIRSTKLLLGEDFYTETGTKGYPGVYLNGAVVYDSDGNLIKLEKFSEDFLNKFYKFMSDNNLFDKVSFFTDQGGFCLEPLYEFGAKFIEINRITPLKVVTFEELKKMNVVTISFPSVEYNIEGLKRGVDYQYKISDKIVVTLTPGTCTKKKGLELLLKHLKTDPSNCSYIGDGENDIEALDYCPSSFVVADAPIEVQQHSSWIVDLKHDQGAFQKVVKCMCL